MEQWRQCGRWLIDCKVLPPNHRVVWPSAVVFDLAQALRDGVLLCQLLHNLSPGSIDLKDINFRPQMSQVRVRARREGPRSPDVRSAGREDADSEVADTGGSGTVLGAAGRGTERGARPGPLRPLLRGATPGRREVDQSPPSRERASAVSEHGPGAPGVRGGSSRAQRPLPLPPAPGPGQRGPARVLPDPTEPAAPAGLVRSRVVRLRAGFWTWPWRTSRRSGRGRRGPAGRGAGARPAEAAGGPAPSPASSPSWSGAAGAPSAPGPHNLVRREPPTAFPEPSSVAFVVVEARVAAGRQENVCSLGRSCLSWAFKGNLAET